MSNRDIFIDAMSGLDEGMFAEHISRKYPSKKERYKKYLMAVAIYAAACIAVAIVLPYIAGQPEPDPLPGNTPVKNQSTDLTGATVTEVIPETDILTNTLIEEITTAVTETESTTTTIVVEEVLPPVTDAVIPAVTVHVHEMELQEPSEDAVEDNIEDDVVVVIPETSVSTSVSSTKKPAATTTTDTKYSPQISERTPTSVTKQFFDCDYTLTIDKDKYEQGDIITVTVTLTNNGHYRLDLYDYIYSYDGYYGLTHRNFLDRVTFRVGGVGTFDYSGEGYNKRTTLMPGKSMSYTTKYDTTDAYVKSNWLVRSELYFTVNGKRYSVDNNILVSHDGDVGYTSDVGYFNNPFDNSKYSHMFKGNGEIVITFAADFSENWMEHFVSTRFFELFKIEKIVKHMDSLSPRVTVSIYLYDKSEFNVNSAMNELYMASRANKGSIHHAYPVLADYSVAE